MSTTHPSILRPDEVPNELKCAICFSVPVQPKILPCEHVFCSDCIHRAFDMQSNCPTCRTSCCEYQISDLSKQSLAYRIWTSIQVKCSHKNSNSNGESEWECSWTGSISDFEAHRQMCSLKNNHLTVIMDKHEVDELKALNTRLHILLQNIRIEKEDKEYQMQAQLQEKENQINQLIAARDYNNNNYDMIPKINHLGYDFKRENVVTLAQLISRYLENKPLQIDSNRIYQCVHNCYQDLDHGYNDNPEHYRLDMHMLLTTCLASNWFTDKQIANMQRWVSKHW